MKYTIRLLAATLALLVWVGCAPKTAPRPHLAESLEPFLAQLPPPPPRERLAALYADLLAHRYAPWQQTELNATYEEVTWPLRHFERKRLYGSNRLPLPQKRYRSWVRNARYDALDTLKKPAIVVHPSSLRLFPTHRPIFYDPSLPGEGFPFDYNQNSAIKAMTPLYVSHLSLDGGWAYVQSPFATGWIPLRDIAFVTKAQIDRLMAAPLVVTHREGLPLYDERQRFLFYAKSATLLPLAQRQENMWRILLARKGAEGAELFETQLPLDTAAPMPLPMTPPNVRRVASTLLGEPYGWGGMLQDRDCSATTRDFFMPFGIWLPRNSAQQAKVGRVVSLKGLRAEEKERRIIQEGVPFRTLLHLPGHIMLYVGHVGNRAYVMHNLWGIRTKGGGRRILGRAVLSDLHLGENLPETDPKAVLIERIDSMNVVDGR